MLRELLLKTRSCRRFDESRPVPPELLRELVAVGEDGYIPADETGETGRPGIYVAGDIRKKPLRQVVTAVADGANAAVSAGNYCNRFR